MATFVCTWDAGDTGYPPREYAADIASTAAGRPASARWSVGSRRGGMSAGDRVYLLRQKVDRGIVASGRLVDGEVFEAPHWGDPARSAWYVDIDWDRVLLVEDRLPVEVLLADVGGHDWDHMLSSGQQLYPPNDGLLEARWASHITQVTSGYSWATPVGALLGRRERMAMYGDGLYGGMEPSATTPNVFLYSDPPAGRAYGYDYDGWSADGSVFLYTGEGRVGHQQIREGNRAALNHEQDGRALRVFVADGTEPGSSAKRQCYIGEFRIDEDDPFTRAEARDAEGDLRTVLVFRLLPIGAVLRRPEDRSGTGDAPRQATAHPIPVDSAATPAGSTDPVPLEASDAGSYRVAGSTETTATRREAELVARYQAHLEAQGSTCVRYRIRPHGELRDLYTDLFDQTDRVLYEAKGVSTREAIRMAVGQLLDYSRHLPTPVQLGVLLPAGPADDLLDLLDSQSIRCVYETAPGQFEVW